jgi:hypothetical protein
MPHRFPRPFLSATRDEMRSLDFPTRAAPFTADQVDRLRKFQDGGTLRPYQCCYRTMVPTAGGLKCPSCGRLQTWAHAYSTDSLQDHPQ